MNDRELYIHWVEILNRRVRFGGIPVMRHVNAPTLDDLFVDLRVKPIVSRIYHGEREGKKEEDANRNIIEYIERTYSNLVT